MFSSIPSFPLCTCQWQVCPLLLQWWAWCLSYHVVQLVSLAISHVWVASKVRIPSTCFNRRMRSVFPEPWHHVTNINARSILPKNQAGIPMLLGTESQKLAACSKSSLNIKDTSRWNQSHRRRRRTTPWACFSVWRVSHNDRSFLLLLVLLAFLF